MANQPLRGIKCAYNCEHVGELSFETSALFAAVRRTYGLHIHRLTRSLQAVVANEREASALNVPMGFPLRLVEDISYLDDGRPMMLTESRFRGDRSEFTFEVRLRGSL